MLASSSSPRYTDRLRKPPTLLEHAEHAHDVGELQTPKAAAAKKSIVKETDTKMKSIVKVTKTPKKNPLFIEAGMVVCWLRTALSLLPTLALAAFLALARPRPSSDGGEDGRVF